MKSLPPGRACRKAGWTAVQSLTIDVGIDLYFGEVGTSEQSGNRHAGGLSDKVPNRLLDAA